ncbi:MAG: hypothetical protein QOE97_3605 [Pseudonocardiales bacterium]|jgi:hypothetical protein|nr:hypothetical protein [Pseudonocardiales bacterium]
MAKHRTRSLQGKALLGVVVTAVALLATALIGSQTANAAFLIPDNKTVSPTNSDVFSKCILQVKSVNPLHSYDTTVKLSGQAQPNNANGYANNVFTQVFCDIFDPTTGGLLAHIQPYSNSATVLNTSQQFVLPFRNSYTLCGQTLVKLVNGNTSLTPYVCA